MRESQLSSSSSAVPVALLHEAGDRDRHLKDALNELGAAIVYEAQAKDLDRAALAGSGARIVVFNLDPDSEGEIDQVCEVLDQGGYEVVFNDADASGRLSGTDQARWARHLAAKILRNPDISEPPRPAWAESVPVPGERVAPVAPAAATDVAPEPAVVEETPRAATALVPEFIDEPAAENTAAVAAAAEMPAVPAEAELHGFELPSEFVLELSAEPPAAEAEAPASPAVTETPTLELPVLDEFNLEEITLDSGTTGSASGDDAQIELSGEFANALEDFAAHVPAHQYSPRTADEFASELDNLFADARGGRVPKTEEKPAVEAAEFPAAFDQFDAAAATIPEAVDGSFKPAPLPSKRGEPDATASEPLLPPEWSLEPLDENAEVKPLAGKSGAFGIETMSASDFLAPEDDGSVPPPPPMITSDGLSLELMPMEDAVAPEEYASAVPAAAPMSHEGREPGKLKVGSGAPLRRVIVLGASIGGPEAVREFLGALPRNFPALFVLAQHMGDEFLELMSAQLAKAVSLTVRTPTHGERVGHGEVVIVPTRQRLQIDSEGVITLSPLIERTAYSPSIDQVMRDVADEFGERAGAIVFSGMAQDAIDGSKYLQSRGGTVWAQDPNTCTISTMVDSVRQTGVVAFVASPDQLAAKMIADHGSDK